MTVIRNPKGVTLEDLSPRVRRNHGPAAEKAPNQIPITSEDFANLPGIIAASGNIEPGEMTKQGLPSIVMKKWVNGHIYVVEEIREGRGKLAIKTIWKKKAGDSSGEDGLQHTPETLLPREQAPGAKPDGTTSPGSDMSPTGEDVNPFNPRTCFDRREPATIKEDPSITTPVKRSEMIKNLREHLGLPIRQDLSGYAKEIAGIFKLKSKVIRARNLKKYSGHQSRIGALFQRTPGAR